MRVARNDWSVIEEIENATGMPGEESLLLGPLDDGGEVQVIGFFELLTGDVGELSFSDKRLRFRPNEFLLQLDNLRVGWFFVLELLNFIRNLWSILALYQTSPSV